MLNKIEKTEQFKLKRRGLKRIEGEHEEEETLPILKEGWIWYVTVVWTFPSRLISAKKHHRSSIRIHTYMRLFTFP